MLNARRAPLLFLAAMPFAFSGTAAAASLSGELEIKGTLSTECSVEVRATGSRLDLVAGETLKAVARVEETCNSEEGYTLTVSSRNRGALVSDDRDGARVPYRVAYDGVVGTLEKPLRIVRQEPWFGRETEILVSVTGDPTLLADTYRDEITVQISAK